MKMSRESVQTYALVHLRRNSTRTTMLTANRARAAVKLDTVIASKERHTVKL